MNKAAINIGVKSVSEDERRIEGWATRIEEDRMGDVVVPRGVVYKLPLPLLLDHDTSKAVGQVDKVEVTDKGIRFWAHIKKIAEDGDAKRLTDYAWDLLKNHLRSMVSIGFRALDTEQIPNSYGIKFKSWEWLELSAVSIPAQPLAAITAIKSVGDIFVTVTTSEVIGAVPLVRIEKNDALPKGAVRLISP
jgi:HK97 family phage prohead protease